MKQKNLYPTAEEILKNPYVLPPQEREVMLQWKEKYFNNTWGTATTIQKLYYLEKLAHKLAKVHQKPVNVQLTNLYAASAENPVIYLDYRNPSIISTLHEMGHHLFGSSELKACSYSVHIFKEIFPKQYEKLTWEGHKLIKK